MRCALLVGAASAALFLAAQAYAAPAFSDGFESYNVGGLASTDTHTTNPGTANPWWAPPNNNGVVTGAVNGVTPYSGNQMLKGAAPADIDQDVVNLSHRIGGDSPLMGNFQLDFAFYDVNGAGDTHNTGYAELGYYDGVPNNADYNATHTLSFTSYIQRVILGPVGNNGGDLSVYQARVLGGTPIIGTGYASTYINTLAQRSVGWHLGRILVGPQLPTGGNDIQFFVDNMTTPAAEATTTMAKGYNVLVLDTQIASSATTLNYFDNVSVTFVPEPASLSLLGLAALPLLSRRRRA